MKRYSEWVLKHSTRAQCSPGSVVLGLLIVLGIVCYMYRHVIEMTLMFAGIAIAGVTMLWIGIALILNARQYRKTHATVGTEPDLADVPDLSPADVYMATHQHGMAEEADVLADPSVLMTWTPDGNIQVTKK